MECSLSLTVMCEWFHLWLVGCLTLISARDKTASKMHAYMKDSEGTQHKGIVEYVCRSLKENKNLIHVHISAQ